MKMKIASCLLAAALLPACTSTKQTTTSSTQDDKGARYADNASRTMPAPPAEGTAEDIPSEGPPNVAVNPAYVPTPLLRASAASHP